MQHNPTFWTITLAAAVVAVATAAAGLLLNTFMPTAPALVGTGLLLTSLGATATAFGRVALQLRRLQLENEGLIEEISQEFDSVKDKIEIFAEALDEPRSISPEEAEADQMPMRRVAVK